MSLRSSVTRLGDQGSIKQITIRGDRGTLEASITLAGAHVRHLGDARAPGEDLAVPPEYGAGRGDAGTIALFREQPIGGRAFIDAIIARRPATPDFRDGWRVQEVIDAALRSDAGGRWENVAG